MKSKLKLIIITFLFLLQPVVGANDNVDSLRSTLSSSNDAIKVDSYIKLIEYYHNINVDSALYFSNKLYNLSDSLKYEDGKIAALVGFINVDFTRGDYVQCINKALPHFRRDSTEINGYHFANLHLVTGNCFGSLGLYGAGLEHYLEARTIFEKNEDQEKLNTISNNLGAYYIRLGDYESALEVFNTLPEFDPTDPVGVTISVNLGFIYLGLKQYQEAEKYLKQALEVDDSSIGVRAKAIASYNLGNLYNEIGSHDTALTYYDRSLTFYSRIGNEAQIINPLNGIAKTYLSLNNLSKAEETALKAVEIGEQNKTLLELNDATNLLATIYGELGDYQKAYFFSVKNIELTDSSTHGDRA